MRANLPTILILSILGLISMQAIHARTGPEPGFVLKLDKNADIPSLQDLESGDISLNDLLPDSSDFVESRYSPLN